MEEKPFQPSSYKLKKARGEGNRVKSPDLATALVLGGGVVLLFVVSSVFKDRGLFFLTHYFSRLNTLTIENSFWFAFRPLVWPFCILLLGFLFIGGAAHLIQTGWQWKRVKGRRKRDSDFFFRFAWALLKLAIILGVAGGFLFFIRPSLFRSLLQKKEELMDLSFGLSSLIVAVLVILGIVDFFCRRWRFYKKMRMTKQELQEEMRELEGNREAKSTMRGNLDRWQ